MAGLIIKHQAFVDYFTDDTNKETYHNVKRSYMAAYPKSSEKAAESNGIRLIRRDKILKAIQRRLDDIRKQSNVTREEVIGNARWLVKNGKGQSKGQDVAAGNLQLGRIAGVFDDKLSISGEQEQQKKLTEAEQAEIKRLTSVRLAEMTA